LKQRKDTGEVLFWGGMLSANHSCSDNVRWKCKLAGDGEKSTKSSTVSSLATDRFGMEPEIGKKILMYSQVVGEEISPF